MSQPLMEFPAVSAGEIFSPRGKFGNSENSGLEPLERAIAATNTKTKSRLRRDEKAAIIVRLLLGGMTDLPLAGLEAGNLAQLVRATAGLSYIDEKTTLDVIDEFLAELNSLGIYFRPGIEHAMTALEDHISDEVNTLLASNKPKNAPEDPWISVGKQEPEKLAEILANETPPVCAVVLSKITPVKAAEILAMMDPELAGATTLAASRAGHITQNTVADIGQAIATALAGSKESGAFSGDPLERVGAILNFTPGSARQNLLNGLESVDAGLAENIRKVMFTFADIPDRVAVADVTKIVRAVDGKVINTALAGGAETEKRSVEFILGNLSKRLADQISEEVAELGDVKVKDADSAMSAVVQVIRDLESSKAITLIDLGD